MRRNQLHGWRSLVAHNRHKVPTKVTETQTFLKAAALRRLRLLRMMVDGGVDVNMKDVKGHTALMWVIMSSAEDEGASSRETVVEYLLRKGADPNIQDFNGQTALVHACLQSVIDIGVVQLLVMYKADPFVKDLFNRDAVMYVSNKHSYVKNLLLESSDGNESRRVKCRNDEEENPLKHSNSLESESQHMYAYLVVPDNAKRRISKSLLTLPSQKETKWSPKLNRKNPFYCVQELDMQYDNDGETEGVILRCPNFIKSSFSKRNSLNDGLPKVQLSNENGETRLLFELPSNQFQLQKMKSSLFDWERQLSQEEDGKQNDKKHLKQKKELRKSSCANQKHYFCTRHRDVESRKKKNTKALFSAVSSYFCRKLSYKYYRSVPQAESMQKRASSAPSVMIGSKSTEQIYTAAKSWSSDGSIQSLSQSALVN